MLLGAFLVMSCEVLNVNSGGNESMEVETRVASLLTEMPPATASPLEHALSMDEATQTAVAEEQKIETRVAQALEETQTAQVEGRRRCHRNKYANNVRCNQRDCYPLCILGRGSP